jgi:hypothetical protein
MRSSIGSWAVGNAPLEQAFALVKRDADPVGRLERRVAEDLGRAAEP